MIVKQNLQKMDFGKNKQTKNQIKKQNEKKKKEELFNEKY